MKTDELIALLARHPEARPDRHPRRDWGLAVLASLASALTVMVIVLGPREDLARVAVEPLFLQKMLALGLMVALAAIAAFRTGLPGRDRSGPSRARWLVPGWLVVATAATVLATPAEARLGLFGSPTILVCLTMVPTLSVIPAVAMTWALRRAAPTEPRSAARAVGWAAGAVGGFAYAFHCQADQPGYVLLWYGLAVALTVAFTQAIATRWLRW